MRLHPDAALSLRAFAAAGLRGSLAFALPLLLLAWSGKVRAQELSNELVVSLPPETLHVELIRLSRFRELPSYRALRRQYTSPRLADLELSLTQLGIQATDIDQILLAWQLIEDDNGKADDPPANAAVDLDVDGGSLQNRWPTLFGGLAAGRFNAESIAKKAAENGIPSVPVGDRQAYCVTGNAPACIVILQESLGAFGNLKNLRQIVAAREGKESNLLSSRRLLSLVNDLPPEASLWGVAIDSGIADWFSGWPLAPGDMHPDWKELLKPVETLRYSLNFDDKIRLTMELHCKDSQTAAFLTQAFRGMRLIQAWTWQKQNPKQSNPLESMDIQASGEEVLIALTTTEDSLRSSSLFPTPATTK